MTGLVASLLALILAALAAMHVAWAAGSGGRVEGFVPSDGGRPLFTPGPLATLAVAAALAAAALVVLCGAGLVCLGLPPPLARIGIWIIALLFAARAVGEFRYVGFFKRVRDTRFARLDSWIFSPLCVVIAALAATVGWSP